MAKKNNKNNGKAKNAATPAQAPKENAFILALKQVLEDKYGRRIPAEYETLAELLCYPQELTRKDKKGPVISKLDPAFRIERTFEELLEDLEPIYRSDLIPKTYKESRELVNFASNTRLGSLEDTIWRKITAYGNWNRELTQAIASRFSGKNCLEIMAGNGLFASLLIDSGLKVIATDITPGKTNDYISMRDGNYTDVMAMDALGAIKRFGAKADLLIVSWPPHQEEQVLKALQAYTRLKPEGQLLYVGEWKGGFNATDEFFDSVEVVDPLEEINKLHVSHIGSKDVIRLVKLR